MKKDDKLKIIYVVYQNDGHFWRTPVKAINRKEAKKKILNRYPYAKHIKFF